jgi:hypothetical protein
MRLGIRFLTSNVGLLLLFQNGFLEYELTFHLKHLLLRLCFNGRCWGLGIATGKVSVTDDYTTNGTASAAHTESFVPLPTGS